MANSVNKVILIGNLGADPEVRSTPNGAQVATIRIACTERWKDKNGQKQEKTEWITCVGWRNHADLLQKYVRKGDKIYIEGALQTRSWEDRNGGGKRFATEVVIREIGFLGGGHGGHGESQASGQNRGIGRNAPQQGGTDDIPDFGEYAPAPAEPGHREPDDDLPF